MTHWLVPPRRKPGGRKAWSEPPFWTQDALRYPWLSSSPLTADREPIENSFEGYVAGAYKGSSPVFSCILARMLVYSEARFQWREYRNGRPGDLFGSPELALLETPWPNGTTGDLLGRVEVDSSLAGNFYATTADDDGKLGRAATGPGLRVSRMRPDWTQIVIDAPSGDPNGLDARVVAYVYQPPAVAGLRSEPTVLLPSEVAHYAPIPDPVARYRGMSWITPLINEIRADQLASKHKLNFFANGASPNLLLTFDRETAPEAFHAFVAAFKAEHQGSDSAFKTLFLGGGADATPLTMDFQKLDFKIIQGHAETRVAAAARIHPVLAGFSEGLAGSSLNAGNYGSAKRSFVDGTVRPLWRTTAASLQTLLTPPSPRAHLWYDERDISYLREDARDNAEIQQLHATSIRTLVDAGFDPAAVVDAVWASDLSRIAKAHSGLYSVQLQAPGSGTPEAAPAPSSNGAGPPAALNGRAR